MAFFVTNPIMSISSFIFIILFLLNDAFCHRPYVVFEAGLSGRRHYEVDRRRTPTSVVRKIWVNHQSGQVKLYWPNLVSNNTRALLPVYVVSRDETGPDRVDYVSMPFLIAIPPFENETPSKSILNRLESDSRRLRSLVSIVATPDNELSDNSEQLCFKKSRPLLQLRNLLPFSLTKCKISYEPVQQPHFVVEPVGGHLVARYDHCFAHEYGKVMVTMTLKRCGPPSVWPDNVKLKHNLEIIFHRRGVDKFDNRVLRNQAISRSRRDARSGDDIRFDRTIYLATVSEEKDPGEPVTTITATSSRRIGYTMLAVLDARSQAMFRMDGNTGQVVTTTKLDREYMDTHYFRITAVDPTDTSRSATTTLKIELIDVNDHPPVFEQDVYEAHLREGVPVGSTVVTVRATDRDADDNGRIAYELLHNENMFRVDSQTGVVSTRRQLDRETVAEYELAIKAVDQGSISSRKSATTTVKVYVLDDNDNYPQFSQRTYALKVPEDVNWTANPVVAQVVAADADSGPNGAVRYTLVSGNTQGKFLLDGVTGQLSVAGPLDYEETRHYRLAIRAQDSGSPSRSNTTQVLVNLEDVNDNTPRFYSETYHEIISEDVPIGTSVLQVQAYDADDEENAKVKYHIRGISNLSDDWPFALDEDTGWLTTVKVVDREKSPNYSFAVEAMDGGSPVRSATATVTLVIHDINDNNPAFESETYEAVVAEDALPGTSVVQVVASDPDENSRLVYHMTEGNIRGRFSIDGRGVVSVAQPLDYKQEKRFILSLSATDSGGRSAKTTLYINVTDANTHRPIFELAPYSTSFLEDVPIGTTVFVVSATDGDVGENARVTYMLDNSDGDFKIDPDTGAIVTLKLLDREKQAGYIVSVTATDHGQPPMADTTDVELTVADVNDNSPIFDKVSYEASVSEDAPVGTSVLVIKASDDDQGLNGRVRYTLGVTDGAFSLDPTSGILRTAKELDRETIAVHKLVAVAVDRGSPELSASAQVTIHVDDINDNPPRFPSDSLKLSVKENSPVGTVVASLKAEDPDEGQNAKVTYSIAGGPDAGAFSLSSIQGDSGAELVLRVEVDYESAKKKFQLILRAASPPLRSDVPIEVLVEDVNDNAPILKDFKIYFNNYFRHFPKGPIGKVPAFDADVTDNLTYTFVSGNNAQLIRLNQDSGDINLNPSLDTNVPLTATLEVKVSDGVNEVSAECQLFVLMVTDAMLFDSVTLRISGIGVEEFLSPLMSLLIDGIAAVVPCAKEDVFLFNVQDDEDDETNSTLKVSFAVRKVDESTTKDVFYPSQFLKERIYPERSLLAKITTLLIQPFDDDLCVREPCLDFERCLSVHKFGNASTGNFLSSDTVLFRPIQPVDTFACRCPKGFAGAKEHYLCDVEVDLCYSNPCKNGGKCVRSEGGFTCVCPEGFTGSDCGFDINRGVCGSQDVCRGGSTCVNYIQGGITCEKCLLKGGNGHVTPFCELTARRFTRGSFLTLPSMQQRHRFTLSVQIATVEAYGLIFYAGRYNDRHDFIALEIVDGAARFSFSLGSNVSQVTVRTFDPLKPNNQGRLDDGEWHSIHMQYLNRTATLWLDNCDYEIALQFGSVIGNNYTCANRTVLLLDSHCSDVRASCHRFLDLTGPLQLGGLPSIPTTFQVLHKDYEGCIRRLTIDNKLVDLNSYVVDNGTTEGCPSKRAFCFSSPCKNGGTCVEHWKSYTCNCKDSFGGKDCEKSIDVPRYFKGDGFVVYNPSPRPIQSQWINSLTVKTTQSTALLLKVHLGSSIVGRGNDGREGSVIMALVDGLLTYIFNGQQLVLRYIRMDDGEWHHVEAKWMAGGIWMSVDYGRFEVVGKINLTVQGLFVSKVSVAGREEAVTGDLPNFKGCIKDMWVGGDPNVLSRPSVESNVRHGCPTVDYCLDKPCSNASRCVSQWDRKLCRCMEGHYGSSCVHGCHLKPCLNGGTCIPDDKSSGGYRCMCSSHYRGAHCHMAADGPCPSGWWGKPSCGPCNCLVNRGYDPNCDQTTGLCRCREDHFKSADEPELCLPCDCYRVGSFGTSCDISTGQCRCRSGVIGRRCDSCPQAMAEVTLRGCEVIYDGCPKSFDSGIWWERTFLGETAVQNCPIGMRGKASRKCTTDDGWKDADLFNCSNAGFSNVMILISELDAKKQQLDSDLIVKLSRDLQQVINATSSLHGSDLLNLSNLIKRILIHEAKQTGLNLSHKQDRDFLTNILEVVSHLLDPSYINLWTLLRSMGHPGPESLVTVLDNYTQTLVRNRGDTFTRPFEIITKNVIFGIDTVAPTDVTTSDPASVTIPKYNNYPARYSSTFDRSSKIVLPASVILPKDFVHERKPLKPGSATTPASYRVLRVSQKPNKRGASRSPTAIVLDSKSTDEGEVAAVAYVIFSTIGPLLQATNLAKDVRQRWETPLVIQSPVITLDIRPAGSSLSSQRPSGNPLPFIIKFAIQTANNVSDPQCVHWSKEGQWSSKGCTGKWIKQHNRTSVNCSCTQLSTYAVLMDFVGEEDLHDLSLAEDIATTVGLSVTCLALTMALFVFCFILHGTETNSNTIHKNLTFCCLIVAVGLMVALRLRKTLVHKDFACKITAIFLHHIYLCQFSWMLVEAVHLYRMLTELRDINHGQMRFYYAIGYGVPAIVVGLSVGVRADEYGNPLFCWLSIYGSAIWSMVGPVCVVVLVNLCIFVLAMRAGSRLKEHVEDFGNLKTLLWLGIVLLPLMGSAWVSAVLAVNDNHPVLYYIFAVLIAAQGVYIFIGYCILNEKVRNRLSNCVYGRSEKRSTRTNTGVNTASVVARSALAYHNNSFDALHRNIGISTSSTTSRSTCKTTGSLFRPRTATSTSTPASQYPDDFISSSDRPTQRSDGNRYPFGRSRFNNNGLRGRRKGRRNGGRESESESDGSMDNASLDLASSHSSDEEETTVDMKARRYDDYAPNIVSEVESNSVSGTQKGTYNIPAALNGYTTRWSARGPSSLPPFAQPVQIKSHSQMNDGDDLSVVTASDNEVEDDEGVLTEAVFGGRFSPALIDADALSSPEQLPSPERGGFGSQDSLGAGSIRTSAALQMARNRMLVPPMITAESESNRR
ncbi:hypothetical protein CHUAL_003060 [Chamberlinius hualienensis]